MSWRQNNCVGIASFWYGIGHCIYMIIQKMNRCYFWRRWSNVDCSLTHDVFTAWWAYERCCWLRMSCMFDKTSVMRASWISSITAIFRGVRVVEATIRLIEAVNMHGIDIKYEWAIGHLRWTNRYWRLLGWIWPFLLYNTQRFCGQNNIHQRQQQ